MNSPSGIWADPGCCAEGGEQTTAYLLPLLQLLVKGIGVGLGRVELLLGGLQLLLPLGLRVLHLVLQHRVLLLRPLLHLLGDAQGLLTLLWFSEHERTHTHTHTHTHS